MRIHIGKSIKTFKDILTLEKFCDDPLDTSLNVSPFRDALSKEKDIEEVEEVPPLPAEDIVQRVKEDLEPYKLRRNDKEMKFHHHI